MPDIHAQDNLARQRGRPIKTVRTPHDNLQTIWLHIEFYRALKKRKTGQILSASRACVLTAQNGGLVWIVGGDRDAIAQAMENNKERDLPISKWRRYRLTMHGRNRQRFKDDDERLFASHIIQDSDSLRTRYTEAQRLVAHNPFVKEAWTNMLHDMLGLPRPYRRRIGPGQSPLEFSISSELIVQLK